MMTSLMIDSGVSCRILLFFALNPSGASLSFLFVATCATVLECSTAVFQPTAWLSASSIGFSADPPLSRFGPTNWTHRTNTGTRP